MEQEEILNKKKFLDGFMAIYKEKGLINTYKNFKSSKYLNVVLERFL